jgi:hypothetical protein
MEPEHGLLIRVHREWHGWRSAEVRFGDLRDVHWFQQPGAPHSLIHAYVSCTALVTGDIPHDCDAKSAPHRLLVCVLKRHALPSAYTALVRCADQQRTWAAIKVLERARPGPRGASANSR